MGKSCSYGLCTSRECPKKRTVKRAEGIFFTKFPSPKNEPERCHKWVIACGRPNFDVSHINRWKYVCSRHFHGFRGPTPETPDPIPLHEVLSPQLIQGASRPSIQRGNTVRKTIGLNLASIKAEQSIEVEAQIDTVTPTNPVTYSVPTPFPSPYLHLKALIPPIGWALEHIDKGVQFFKTKNDWTVIKWVISYPYDEELMLKFLDKAINIRKLVPAFRINSNADIYTTLKQLDNYTFCPGNSDEDLVDLYTNNLRTYSARTKSFYCDRLKTVYSGRCERFLKKNSQRARCSACSTYRGALRNLNHRSKTASEKKSDL